MACADDDRLVTHQVVDRDAVFDRVNEGPVTAVGGRPDRAADGGRGVASSGAELAVSAGVQQLEHFVIDSLQLAKLGAPLNPPSTSDTVAMPLLAPLRSWVTLKTAPPKVAVWVLALRFLDLPFLAA